MVDVLVVDDNVDAAETLALLLKTYGHDVAVALDGPHALKMAVESPPDVVLLDIGLPGIDGFEVAKRLREMGLKSVLVAMTGYSQGENARRFAEAGFEHHLVKPVSLEALRAILGAVSDRLNRLSASSQG